MNHTQLSRVLIVHKYSYTPVTKGNGLMSGSPGFS